MTLFNPAPALYSGQVFHTRHASPPHRFRQPMLFCLMDLDALPHLSRHLQLFSYNRLNLFAFYDRDHGPRDGTDLSSWVHAGLCRAGISDPGGPVHLLAQPRVLGHVFNPLSLFLCCDSGGAVRAVIYEVHNTFGESHAYAAAIRGEPRRGTVSAHRHGAVKAFRVSPFLPGAGSYAFSLELPGRTVGLTISLADQSGIPLLTARLAGQRKPFTDRSLLAEFGRLPFSTLRASAAIYRQAAIIAIKAGLAGGRFR